MKDKNFENTMIETDSLKKKSSYLLAKTFNKRPYYRNIVETISWTFKKLGYKTTLFTHPYEQLLGKFEAFHWRAWWSLLYIYKKKKRSWWKRGNRDYEMKIWQQNTGGCWRRIEITKKILKKSKKKKKKEVFFSFLTCFNYAFFMKQKVLHTLE